MIPFKIAKTGKALFDALKAGDWKTFAKKILDTVLSIPSLFRALLSPYNILKSLKAIASIPVFGLVKFIYWPISVLDSLVGTWDLGKRGKTLHVLRTGSKNLESRDTAIAELDRLKKLNLKDVVEQLEVSEQCKVAEKIDTLRARLVAKEPTALQDTKEFYAKMKKRATLTLTLKVFHLAMAIASIVVVAFSLFTPFAPAAFGLAFAALEVGMFAVWAGKKLFLKNDIFDPNAKNLAQKSVTWMKDKAVKFKNLAQYIFKPTPGCVSAPVVR